MTQHNRGLLALSADPITIGHIDLVRKAAKRCNDLIVLIANNDQKMGKYLFPLETRVAMCERALEEANIRNARVIGSSGLLVDVYLREGCDVIIRGIRNATDYTYEQEQMALHALILPELTDRIEYIQANKDLVHISSTMVKAFASHHLDITDFIPLFVKQMVEEQMLGQYKIAVTGSIAVGKSFVASELTNVLREQNTEAHHINLDQLIRELYAENTAGAQNVRDRLAELLGNDVLTENRTNVNREKLAEKMFAKTTTTKVREEVHTLTAPHVERKYREALHGKRGLIVFEWAQLAEMHMGHYTNNNVIVVDSPDKEAFANKRGINKERLEELSVLQKSASQKLRMLQSEVDRADHGQLLLYTNRLRDSKEAARKDLEKLADQLVAQFPALKETT